MLVTSGGVRVKYLFFYYAIQVSSRGVVVGCKSVSSDNLEEVDKQISQNLHLRYIRTFKD